MSDLLVIYQLNDGKPREIEASKVIYSPDGCVRVFTISGGVLSFQKSQVLMISEKLSRKELMR